MKNIFSLCVVLCLCFFFTGCDKEDEIVYYTDDLLAKNGINDVEVLFSNETIKDHSVWYYGLRKGKEWFALFDKSANSLTKEWYGKEISIKDLDYLASTYWSCPEPGKIGNDEYLLWCIPCAGRIKTNVVKLQLTHLQADGSVKYGKALTDDKDWPYFFLKGKGWLATSQSGNDRCIYDSSFEKIIVEDVAINEWDSLQMFTGFYNDRLWLGFVKDQSILTNEYLAEKPFERKRKVHLGYGQYKEYTIKNVYMSVNLSIKGGYAFIPSYLTTDNEYIGQDVILLNDEKIIYCPLDDGSTTFSLRAWYKESILVNDKYVISPQGEKLYEGDFFSMYYDYNIPTSYSSWMKMNQYGIYMYKVGADCVWYTLFDAPIASNAKITYSLLKQEGNIWTFRCDIVNYDGSKEQMTFNVNIETGELIFL